MSSHHGLDDGLDAAVRAFRTAAWAWLAVVSALSFASVERPLAVLVGVIAAGTITAAWWRPQRRDALPPKRWRSALVAAELAVAALLVGGDGWVYDDERPHAFGSVWPVAGVLAVAVRAGRQAAVAAGAGLGLARAAGEVASGGDWSASRVLGVASTGVLYALGGWATAWAAERLRTAERLVARSEARAEVAAELHDGVLQTLAVIQRRSDDGELVRLARSQEASLRGYLAGPVLTLQGRTDAGALLRDVASEATDRFGLRIEVAAVPPLPELDADLATALRGAVGEALANVAKHAGTDQAVVFAEAEEDQLVVGVQDRGRGFTAGQVPERGLETSVRRRVASAGGSTVVRSRPGAGTTVTIELPLEGR